MQDIELQILIVILICLSSMMCIAWLIPGAPITNMDWL